MTTRVRTLAFVLLLCSAAMNQNVLAQFGGWSCGGGWNGCELNEGSLYDCYNCPLDGGLCEGYGGEVEYSECVEDKEFGTWTQLCDCVPVPGD